MGLRVLRKGTVNGPLASITDLVCTPGVVRALTTTSCGSCFRSSPSRACQSQEPKRGVGGHIFQQSQASSSSNKVRRKKTRLRSQRSLGPRGHVKVHAKCSRPYVHVFIYYVFLCTRMYRLRCCMFFLSLMLSKRIRHPSPVALFVGIYGFGFMSMVV